MAEPSAFCPYVGLRPFSEADRPYYFGREKEIRSIADNLYGARLTILYGASGVGKSSVLMAGLVPELRKEPRTAVVLFRRWQVAHADALLKQEVIVAIGAADADQSIALDGNLPLDELLKRAADALDGTILLLLDQFEEYFLYFPDRGPEGGFDVELARAITRRDIDAGFLISIREDSLSKLDRFRKRIPTLFGNTHRLSHLRLEAAQLAVVKPLEVYNAEHPDGRGNPVAIEPGLVNTLLADVSSGQVSIAQRGGAGQAAAAQAEESHVEAPYLQLVLERLWGEEMRQRSHLLRLKTLIDLGGAQSIVRSHLDQVMEKFEPRDQALCARVFDRLVTPAGAKVACRIGDLRFWADDLASEVPRVTKILEDNRLLARVPAPPGRAEEDDQYQIFHDVLAAGILDWRTRFLQRTERAEAEALAAQKEREAAEARLRLEQDAARERDLRMAKERAESERRSKRRFQFAMFAFLFAAAWAVWFGFDAWRQTQKAEAAKSAAEAAKGKAEVEAQAAKKAQASLQIEKIRELYAKKQWGFNAAIESVQGVLELDPANAAANESLGQVYYDRGIAYNDAADIDQAIVAFDESLRLDPKQISALTGRAAAQQFKGNLKGALVDYDSAIAYAIQNLQQLENRRESRSDTRELQAEITAQSTQLAQLYLNRGRVHELEGQRQQAMADYSKAIDLQPKYDDAYLARGELYRQENKRAEALADLRMALRYADDDRSRALAKARIEQLGAEPALASMERSTVVIQIVNPADKRAAEAIKLELEQKGFRVPDIEIVPTSKTNGDVRFVSADEQRTATAVAKTVETALAREGFKMTLRTFQIDPKRFPNAKPNAIEVWLPSLASAAQRLMPSY